jgi:hypothetical protein
LNLLIMAAQINPISVKIQEDYRFNTEQEIIT